MAPLSAFQLAELATKLQSILSSTPYACSSLEQLTGGTTSFVFLGTLSNPLSPQAEEERHVIVKYAAPFASCHTDFAVYAARAKYEALLLRTFADHASSPPGDSAEIRITTPKLYWSDEAENLQVIQNVSSTTPLSTALSSLGTNQAQTLGHSLGHWLRNFHTAVSSPPTLHSLSGTVAKNEEAARLKHKLTWEQGSDVLRRLSSAGHLDISVEEHTTWDAARARAKKQTETKELDTVDGAACIVHGDFWMGNVLVPTPPSRFPLTMHIIDFEFAHSSSRATDLGQFIGDLVERSAIDVALRSVAAKMIRGFVTGYGEIDAEMRWTVAVYVGVHVVNWWSRGPPGREDQSEEVRGRGVQLAKLGFSWVRAGWEMDRAVFVDTLLQPVFELE